MINLPIEQGGEDHCADAVLPKPNTVGLSAKAGLTAECATWNEAGCKANP
jgi:hypothetical protein